MPGHDIITIGASAGGVEALAELARGLPGDLPASIFVALHVPSHGSSTLPRILSRNGPLPAQHPDDGDPIRPGQIYVAPPDQHLLIHEGLIRLSRGPRENGVRPAIDPLFRSAALWHGPRVVGVILSGTLDDGTAGLVAVKERGGVAVVQDPADALFPGMPRSALDVVPVDHVLPVSAIGEVLARLAQQGSIDVAEPPIPNDMELESAMADFDLGVIQGTERPGTPSVYACPDCAGVLWEIQDGDLIRYRCRVGHAWSQASLLAAQSKGLEVALWTAFRALEERAALASRMATRFRIQRRHGAASRYDAQAREAKERSAMIHSILIAEDSAAEIPPTTGQEGDSG